MTMLLWPNAISVKQWCFDKWLTIFQVKSEKSVSQICISKWGVGKKNNFNASCYNSATDVFGHCKKETLPIYTAQTTRSDILIEGLFATFQWENLKSITLKKLEDVITKFQTTKNSPLILVDRNFLTKASILQKDEKVFQDIVPGYTLLLLRPFLD